MTEFTLNGNAVQSESPDDTPLLWVIRDELKLKGTKFGCGIAQCGACTVHLDGAPIRSCSVPVSIAAGKAINYEGATGTVDFDANGDVPGFYGVNTIGEDGTWSTELLK